MKTAALTVLLIVGAVVMYKLSEPNLDRYNRHMCAVYGYYEDCKTPLPEELRLK